MSSSPTIADPRQQLRREMGLWDVLLFNIATVLGPRWVAFAAFNGTSSMSLWLLAAVLFFIPTALVISELSTRFPQEGGLYIWTKEAFGDFHGFVSGWTYWIYTVFYFPGLLMASMAMSGFVMGSGGNALMNNREFLVLGSLGLLAVAVWLNIIGLNVGKWLQNAGGVATYIPLLILVLLAATMWFTRGSVTHFTWSNMMPGKLDWGKVNFWSAIAFAFTGLELVSAMSEEIHEPRRTIPRAIFGSGIMIAVIYIVATFAVLVVLPAGVVDKKAGVFQAITQASTLYHLAFLGVVAAVLVTVGNAGGVGSTVAGIARVPFVVGIDRYLPRAFGKIHPRWHTPYIAILVQAVISAVVLLIFNVNTSTAAAYQILVDAAVILYFIPFLYMYAAVIRLAYRKNRAAGGSVVLIPGGKPGVWVAGLLGFAVTLLSIVVAVVPTSDIEDKLGFELKLLGGTAVGILIGLTMYWRGNRQKAAQRVSA